MFKKTVLFIVSILLMLVCMPTYAASGLIVDANLEKAVRKQLKNPNGDLTQADLANLSSLYPQEGNIATLEGLQYAINMKSLFLSDVGIRDISQLSSLTKVTFLGIDGNKIEDILPLQSMSQLNKLVMFGNRVADLSPLNKLNQITDLLIGGNLVEDLKPISRLPLRWLVADSNRIKDISALRDMKSLEYVFLEKNVIEDASPLLELPRLRELHIEKNPLNASAQAVLQQLSDRGVKVTTDLTLQAKEPEEEEKAPIQLTPPGDDKLIKDDRLETLIREELEKPSGPLTKNDLLSLRRIFSLRGEAIESLEGLQYAENLEMLQLADNRIRNLAPLMHLNKLTEIALSDNEIADLTPLQDMTQLTDLDLSDNFVTDLSPLSGLTGLTSLSLWDNYIQDVTPLAGMKDMQLLSLAHNPIRDISPLSSMTELDSIFLNDTLVTDLSILKNCKQLSGLYLNHNGLNAASQALVETFKEKNVEVLDITTFPKQVRVLVDGHFLPLDSKPVIDEGSTLVPLRGIFEKLGAAVTWDDNSQSVTATREGTTIRLQVGSKEAAIDGRGWSLEVAPKLIDGSTMIPVRFVAEALGCEVHWDPANKLVLIKTKK